MSSSPVVSHKSQICISFQLTVSPTITMPIDTILAVRQIFFGFLGFIVLACILSSLIELSSPTTPDHPLQSLATQTIYHRPYQLPDSIVFSLDAILVLGGGPASTRYDQPPLYTQARCDVAADVVQRRRTWDANNNDRRQRQQEKAPANDFSRSSQTQDLPILCLSAGTAHVPQFLSEDGLPVWESTSSAAFLQNKYNLTHLYVETASYDTIGNAWYTRTSHTDRNGWRNLLIVTSEFHITRTKAIFDWIMLLVDPKGYTLHYLATENTGLSQEAVEARRNKELKSLRSVHEYAKQYRTMKDLYYFMTHQHEFYTANKLIQKASSLSSSGESKLVQKSYGGV